MSKFSLRVLSFTPPTLPEQPTDVPKSEFRSPIMRSVAAATSPLKFTVSLPSARDKDALYPATHLQLSYTYEGSGEVFVPSVIKSEDLVKSDTDEEPNVYVVEAPADEVPRAKVNEGTTSDGIVTVYAWRREKLLGKWTVGRIEKLGFVGLKSDDLAVLRQKTWAANRAKAGSS